MCNLYLMAQYDHIEVHFHATVSDAYPRQHLVRWRRCGHGGRIAQELADDLQALEQFTICDDMAAEATQE